MRAACLVVGLTLVACKGQDAPKAADPRPSAASPVPVSPSAPATPSLPAGSAASAGSDTAATPAPAATFETETEDPDWATNTERTIKAVAPELTEIECRQHQCRATLTAATQQELMTKADKLSTEDSLQGTEARGVVLSAPQTVDGKLTMKLYIKYDR